MQKRARHVKYEMSKTIQTDKCVKIVKPNSNRSTGSFESSGNEVFQRLIPKKKSVSKGLLNPSPAELTAICRQ